VINVRYALYNIEDKAVIQWQDTDIYGYPEVGDGQARLELEDESLPSAFDPYTWPSGWWVVDGALTQVAPPPPLSQLVMALKSQAAVRRNAALTAGVVLADATVFAPYDTDLQRISPIALGHSVLGITEIDIQLGTSWRHFTALELEDAYGALMRRREAFYSAESVHCAAIDALFAASDRDGLAGYDIAAGWPT